MAKQYSKRKENSLLIVGSGAMACLFAARFSAASIPVTMLASWGEGLESLNKFGVCVVGLNGKEQVYPVKAIQDPNAVRGVHSALVLVKSWQTARAAAQLFNCLSKDGVALTLQNGIGNREILAQTLGAQRVALGVTTLGATLLGPGRVRPAGDGVISLGVHSRLAPLANMLREAGLVVERSVPPPRGTVSGWVRSLRASSRVCGRK